MSGLDRAAVEQATAGRRLTGQAGAALEVHDELASTNDRAAALAAGGAGEGSLVVAARQTAGRGRHGRPWASPPGGLYASLVLRPDEAMLRRLPATLLAGLAVAEAIDDTTQGATTEGARAELKWPNDVFLAGRKVSGVLGELTRDARGPLLVLGIGVNVTTDPAALPADLQATATSVAHACGRAPAPATLLGAILERFEVHYDAVRQGGGATILAAASARMPVLGKPVRVRLVDRVLEGRAAGLNATGGLVVEADGRRETVVAGEVEEVRPA
ncbi:MAG: biotin--[acetyl-CoA-carboxylase] ligase [Planctomycetes bacterium]|nr:biotin--[acetyl-CoA-carboxylase] ligase [Planctomycetota bacterium]